MKLGKALLRKKRKKESWFKYTMALTHLWLGLLSSIVVFTVCLTGSIYAFKNQIIEIYDRKEVYTQEPGTSPVPLDTLQQLFTSENKTINTIIISHKNNKNHVISYTDLTTNSAQTHYFNPYTAENMGGGSSTLDGFFRIVLNIHRTMLVDKIGKQIVGISTILFCILLLSGFILWLPAKWKDLRNGLKIKWDAKFYRLNYDIHNTLGFYSLILLLFIALTGLYVTYPWMKSAFIVSLGGNPVLTSNASEESKAEASAAFEDMLKQMMEREDEKKEMENVKPVSLDSIMALTLQHLNYKATTLINLPNEENPRFVVKRINTNNWLGAMLPDEITFDKKGELKSIDRFSDRPLHKQFIEISKPLHTGEILGLKSIILYFIVSLIGCSLPVTGFIIWWKKVK